LVRALVPPDPPLGDAELLLRPSTERDVAAIRAVYSESEIRHWMGWEGGPPDEDEASANIERAASARRAGTWAVFRIVDRATDQVVGGVNLRFCEHQTAEISYFLGASARGRGFATRSVQLGPDGRGEPRATRVESKRFPSLRPSAGPERS
jgi:RimJ/RimL family protein N-acetyltransferase